MARRVSAMSSNLADQLDRDLEKCRWFSIQCDESVDSSSTAQLLVFIRMVFEDFSTREELLTLLPLKTTTRGVDIYNTVKEFFVQKKVPLEKLVAVTTDGAPAMIGRHTGFIAHCKGDPDFPKFLHYHCIIQLNHLNCDLQGKGRKFLSVNMVTANLLLLVTICYFVSEQGKRPACNILLLCSSFFSDLTGVCAACTRQADIDLTSPKTVEALSGSCLQIPCYFSARPEQEFNSRTNIFGVWIKSDSRFQTDPNNVVFNSSRTVNSYMMSITGNLREKNCTTLFSNVITSYTDTYYFRIENRRFQATASCDPLRLTVKDSPRSPSIEISGELKEKESVNITCSAFTPCPHSPPELTWNLQQHSHKNMEENTDGTFTTKIQETITLSDQHDGYNITCSAKYPVNEGKDVKTAEKTKTLSVSYAPKNTSVSISPSGLVSAGEQVNLTCSSKAKPPVSHFIWFKISKDGPMNVSEGEFYSFTVTDGGVYYCVAINGLAQQTSPKIQLNIKGVSSMALIGGVTGIIVLISVVVVIWWKKSKLRVAKQTQIQTFEEPAVQEPARASDKEDIHYGEINFSKHRPEPYSNVEQGSGHQQESLYAEIKVSEPVISFTQASESPEDLYAQVKKNKM
uniref:sialic acid-binding Ig-like lectin 12 n=1 Tax=Semicossyphus pulcher TaxID=241346 RepID=UPI0037E75A31